MTLGERIAALRKEKGLSQEALGELVGVSRQAVSKWEADRALPDVHNCIAMSKAFDISLAQLLDLEEQADTPDTSLAAEHLKLVEEITEKYAAAQKRARRRWRWPLVLLSSVLLVGAAWLWEWLNDMDRTIEYLSGELAGLQGEIVSGVGDRVQESLEAERSLITGYTSEIISADVTENTVTFSISITLKEGSPNTTVSFMPRNGSDLIPAVHQGGLTYTGTVSCSIQDTPVIELFVEENGQSRSQPLEMSSFESDYTIRLSGDVRWAALTQGSLSDAAYEPVEIFVSHEEGPGLPEPLTVTQLEIAMLKNDAIADILPIDLTLGSKSHGQWNLHQEIDIPLDISAKAGDTLTFVLLARDNYERKTSCILSRYQITDNQRFEALSHEKITLDNGTYGTEVWK